MTHERDECQQYYFPSENKLHPTQKTSAQINEAPAECVAVNHKSRESLFRPTSLTTHNDPLIECDKNVHRPMNLNPVSKRPTLYMQR